MSTLEVHGYCLIGIHVSSGVVVAMTATLRLAPCRDVGHQEVGAIDQDLEVAVKSQLDHLVFVVVWDLLVEPLVIGLELQVPLVVRGALGRDPVATVTHQPRVDCIVGLEMVLVQLQLIVEREAVLMTEEPNHRAAFGEDVLQLHGRAQVDMLEVAVGHVVRQQHDAALVVGVIKLNCVQQPIDDFLRLRCIGLPALADVPAAILVQLEA